MPRLSALRALRRWQSTALGCGCKVAQRRPCSHTSLHEKNFFRRTCRREKCFGFFPACAGNQEGGTPSWTFPRGTGDGSPWSAACFCWKHLQSTWPRSDFGGGGAAAAAGRGSPVGCLLLSEVPAVRLAAERLRRREGRCGGRTGVPGQLPTSVGSACCPPGREAASAARWPLRRRDGGPPVGCLLLLKAPAVRLAAWRLCRREFLAP